MAQFSVSNPAVTREWHHASNFLVVVAVPDEATLTDLSTKALALGIVASPVVEVDLDDQMTAIAFTPGPAARKLLACYPLALKEAAVAT